MKVLYSNFELLGKKPDGGLPNYLAQVTEERSFIFRRPETTTKRIYSSTGIAWYFLDDGKHAPYEVSRLAEAGFVKSMHEVK